MAFLSKNGHFCIKLVKSMCTSTITRNKLDGRVAVVTASTDGIGLSIAKHLLQNGAKVVVSSRKEENVKKTVSELKGLSPDVLGVVCHVGKKEHRTHLVEKTLETFGGVDVLVSNAGTNPSFGPMLDTTEDHWDKIFDTNVKSAFFLCKEFAPHIEKRGGGSIIFVSSIAGLQPFEFLGPYSVSKTALLGLTKAMAPQCGSMNIRVNCVAPGIIKTKFSQALTASPAIEEQLMSSISLKRLGEVDDVGGVVSFLASDDARYITGETITVTGGMPSRL